jgi:uncharacterized protein (DUF433 family)
VRARLGSFCYILGRGAKAVSRKSVTDIREAAAYTFADAARYLRLPAPTVRAWVVGIENERQRFEPLIHRPGLADKRLSFNNLVEIHVLRAMRTRHDVSMGAVRKALRFAEKNCGIPRLLIHRDLMAGAGDVFLDKYTELISLSRGGQMVLRSALIAHLERVVYDPHNVPLRLFPWSPIPSEAPKKSVVLDPRIGFGKPVTEHRSISTAVLANRFDAGETVEDLAADYGLSGDEVEDALQFERAA